MDAEEQSLEGWTPVIGGETTLASVVEASFNYRGNVTILRRDGNRIVGFVSNRNTDAASPFLEWFDEAGEGPHRLPYAEVETIHFTGKDTAVGKSWAAWAARKEQAKAAAIEPAMAARTGA